MSFPLPNLNNPNPIVAGGSTPIEMGGRDVENAAKTTETRIQKTIRLMRVGITNVLPSTLLSRRERKPEGGNVEKAMPPNVADGKFLRVAADGAGPSTATIPLQGTSSISVNVQRSFGQIEEIDSGQKKRHGRPRVEHEHFKVLYDLRDLLHDASKLAFLAFLFDGGRALVQDGLQWLSIFTDRWVYVPLFGGLVLYTAHYATRALLEYLENLERKKDEERARVERDKRHAVAEFQIRFGSSMYG